MDVSCIPESSCCSYLSLYLFFIFLSLQFSKIFVILFSGTVRPRRLKLGTHVNSGQMYRVYRNQATAVYSSVYSFFFLSNFQTLKCFVTLFSGTVRPRMLKLGTHLDSGQMYRVYRNQAAAAYSSRYFSFFFLSNFQTLKYFVTLFSGTVRSRRMKLVTHMENGWMYRVYRNHAAALICPFIFFFLSNFQTKNFVTLFLGTVRPRTLKLGTHMEVGRCIVYTEIRLLLHIRPFISSFFFLSNFQTLKVFVIIFSGTVRPRRLKLGTHVDGG